VTIRAFHEKTGRPQSSYEFIKNINMLDFNPFSVSHGTFLESGNVCRKKMIEKRAILVSDVTDRLDSSKA